MFDIIPDIHGHADKLDGLLETLGWTRSPAGWRNDEPGREIVFLGDFIDRGPENRRVVSTVRSLVESGKARAVLGNHELNAVHFHTEDRGPAGGYLRPHSEKNLRQHGSFLAELPVGTAETRAVIDWFKTLPLYIETPEFRAVHACWNEGVITHLMAATQTGVLSEEQWIRAAYPGDTVFEWAEITTKGPEVVLPDGYRFFDKDGTERRHVRVKWWQDGPTTWPEIAMSVPDPAALPTSPVPQKVCELSYPATAKPVFFGHYWLTGNPVLQAPNALCLDYSAGKEGPLLAYRWHSGQLSMERIIGISCCARGQQ